jgi:hypothetical protein
MPCAGGERDTVSPRCESAALRLARACGALVVVSSLIGATPEPQPEPTVSITDMMSEIRRVQQTDLEAWTRFSFTREVVRQRLNDRREVERSESLRFEITPDNGGFDERLIEIDERHAYPSEVREHRRAGRFEKHYRRARAGDAVDEGEGFSLAWLTRFPEYTFAGAAVIGGRRCHRLDFGPASAAETGGEGGRTEGRFLEVMSGRLCVDPRTLHLVHAQARTSRPVPLSFGLAKILGLEVELKGTPVANGVWLPREIVVDSHLSILGREVRKRNRFTYSNYRPIPARTSGPESGVAED